MLRVDSGLVLNKAGSKNVNYWLMFCFAPYSHQEKWNVSESPEYKWKRVCTAALSYFGYAIKWNINHSQSAHQHSSASSCVTWHRCRLWTDYDVQNFPGNWESRKSSADVLFRSLRIATRHTYLLQFLSKLQKYYSPAFSSFDCKEKVWGMRNSLPFHVTQ